LLSVNLNKKQNNERGITVIELYYASPSLFGRKVLTVLMEKNLDYEIKTMSFAAGDHKKPEYLKLNPNGQIPTLVDEGNVIYESTAIIEYLEEEYPFPELMPKDSFHRARVRMAEDFCDLHLYQAVGHCMMQKLFHKKELTESDTAPVVSAMKRMEEYLGKKEYLVDHFSLADCAFMPVISTLPHLDLRPLLESFGPMKSYVENVKSRSSFRGADLMAA